MDIAPVRTLPTTQSQQDPVATSSGQHSQSPLAGSIAIPTITITQPHTPPTIHTTTSDTTIGPSLPQVVWTN